LSRNYGNAKIATHELQAVMRRGTPANKYQDLLITSRQQEKRNSSVTRFQTQFRSHLGRQEYVREILFGSLPSGVGTPLGDVNVFDPTVPCSQTDFDVLFGF
jgi:hypothetical protein